MHSIGIQVNSATAGGIVVMDLAGFQDMGTIEVEQSTTGIASNVFIDAALRNGQLRAICKACRIDCPSLSISFVEGKSE